MYFLILFISAVTRSPPPTWVNVKVDFDSFEKNLLTIIYRFDDSSGIP